MVVDAVDTAYALVTASLADDAESWKGLIPQDQTEAAYLMITLTKLSARVLEVLASDRGVDPQVMWQQVMLEAAMMKSD